MTDGAETSDSNRVSWGEVLAPRYLGRFLFLCLGVWLNAADSLITVTITPSIAAEIGGFRYFTWSVAAFLLASIVSGALSGRLSLRMGLRHALLASAAVYASGCALSALAQDFLVFVAGRMVQGLGAGSLMALCYVATTALFPERLWARVFGAIAGVWGVATVLGPGIGGLFAGTGLWRWAFWFFAIQGLVFMAATLAMIPRHPANTEKPPPVAWAQLAWLAIAVGLIACAGLVRPWLAAVLGVGGLASLVWMARINGATPGALLPPDIGRFGGAMAAGFLAIFALEAGSIPFTVYGPAFLQALYGASPLVAGYVVTAFAAGWTVVALLVSGINDRDGLMIRAGAVVIVLGCVFSAWAMPLGGLWQTALGMVVIGSGFGLCWAFMTRRLLSDLDEEQRALASSAVPTTQLIGGAVASAASGALANALGFAEGVDPALASTAGVWLFAAFIPLAVVGLAGAWRLGR